MILIDVASVRHELKQRETMHTISKKWTCLHIIYLKLELKESRGT
jgi:hypothetical protein